ncbi:hypothetical protein ACFLZ2_05180 [Candidatus Margulisiibacteriota bacterium]
MALAAFSETKTRVVKFKVRIFDKDIGLLINNKEVEGDWDFSYSIKPQQDINTGSFKEGPVIGYIADIIGGTITLPTVHPVLADSLKNDTSFKVDYINKKEGEKDDQTFRKSKILTVRLVKNKNGDSTAVYTFRAGSVM